MLPKRAMAQLVLGLVIVGCNMGYGYCGEMDELRTIANNLKESIKSNDISGIMKYISGRICFDEECYEDNDLLVVFGDKSSWPNEVLFFGDYSIRKCIESENCKTVSVSSNEDVWQVALVSHGSSWPFVPVFVFVKDNEKWRLVAVY